MRAWIVVCVLALVASCTATTPNEEDPPLSPGAAPATTEPTRQTRPLTYRPGWGATRQDFNWAYRQARRMSVEELAGQVIVATYGGTRAPVALVRRLHLGGVIVMSSNVRSLPQIRASNLTLRRAIDRPLFVGVDEEGGTVQRLPGLQFPPMMAYGAAGDPKLAARSAWVRGLQLKRLGFTVNFAPVADVAFGRPSGVIGSRLVGSDPRLVGRIVVAAMRGQRSAGVLPVLKHFPGHGSVTSDSHVTRPVQAQSLAWLEQHDFVPYSMAIRQNVPAVMVGHIEVRQVAPGVPATRSRALIEGVLRGDLGFRGLVITDALQMTGVQGGALPPAVAALRNGSDIVLAPPDPAQTRAAIIRAVRRGDLTRGRLVEAATRQLALMRHYDHAPGRARKAPLRRLNAIAAAAVTLVQGPCRAKPRPLVSGPLHVTGPAGARARLLQAARGSGVKLVARPTRRSRELALTDGSVPPRRVDIVVALDTPYVLGPARARIKLATFGSNAASMQALVAVLAGRERAPGRLPVRVAGVSPGC